MVLEPRYLVQWLRKEERSWVEKETLLAMGPTRMNCGEKV